MFHLTYHLSHEWQMDEALTQFVDDADLSQYSDARPCDHARQRR